MATLPEVQYADLPDHLRYVEEEAPPSFDVRGLWAIFYRNRFILLAAMAVSLVIGVLYLLLATPIFQATASVQIEERSSRVLKSNELDPLPSPWDSERFLQTQMSIIRSRSVAQAVANDLRLVGDKKFLEAMKETPRRGPTGVRTPRQADEEQVLAILSSNVDVSLPVDSRIVSISFRSPDPVLAARIANSFAESYIKTDLARKYQTSSYAREFLSGQLEQARQQLERAQRAALEYGRRERLIDASNASETGAGNETPKSLTVSRLVTLNNAYANAVSQRVQAQQKWQQAQGASMMTLPEVLENQSIQELLQKRAIAVAEYQDQRQTRREDFPSVRQAKAQITEFDQQIATLAGNIRSSLRSQYEVAQRQEMSLKEQASGLEVATLDEQQRSVQLSILQRATDTSRSLYDSLLQRFRELSVEAGVQPNNIQLIDKAEIPIRPVSPKGIITLALAVVFGLVSGIVGALLFEQLNDTVRSADDIFRKLGLSTLGSVPMIKDSSVSAELLEPKSVISESYNSIRASLQLASRNGLPPNLMVTSVQPSEGKTTTVYATAGGLARVGKRVVVVDCDLRRPAVHGAFGLDNKTGVSEYLSGQIEVDQAIRGTSIDRVSVVTCGRIPPNPTELLSGTQFAKLLDELGGRFDIVIVDAPPVLGLADAILIGAKVSATMLVMESGRNYRGGLKTAIARLRRGGANIVGAILTKQNIRNLGYGYQYGYDYSYGNDRLT